MAKKKRKRTSTTTRPGAAGQRGTATAPRREAATRVSPPRVAPAEPGGPNRAARKEQARRQREAIRRRAARRRYLRIGAIVLAVLAVAGGITWYNLSRPEVVTVAGCGPIKSIGAATQDRSHVAAIARPALSTYPSHPPTSGPHDSTPLGAGVYDTPPDVYRAIHSLEHGAIIVWFRPDLATPELQQIKDFYRAPANNDHVIVAPYSYPNQGDAGRFPAGQQMILVAWHHMQSCTRASLDGVKAFAERYRAPTGLNLPSGYEGDAPEPGRGI